MNIYTSPYTNCARIPELFRFTDHYEDVFIEGENYLYACGDIANYRGSLTVHEYKKLGNDEWLVYAYASADPAYLTKLEYAPYDVAKDIMTMETRNAIRYSIPEEELEFYDEEFIEEYYVSQWDEQYQEWCDEYMECPKGWEAVIA